MRGWVAMAVFLLCGVQVFAAPWHWRARKPRQKLKEPVQIWHWPAGDAALLVGVWEHARDHIPASWDFAVNCADFPVSCEVSEVLVWWLNINYWGEQAGDSSSGVQEEAVPVDWFERMCVALDSAAAAMLNGKDVLFFCNHGKHRSGALAALFLALVLNISTKEAREMYFKQRGLYKKQRQISGQLALGLLEAGRFCREGAGESRDASPG